jgi:Ca2+-binding RTX toxin-like protein
MADDFAGDTSTTGVVASGGTISGSIETTGDADWFRVELAAGGVYQFLVTGTGDFDPFLEVRVAFGIVVNATNNDRSDTSRDSLITYSPLSNSTIFLNVTGHAGSTGSYNVRVIRDDSLRAVFTEGPDSAVLYPEIISVNALGGDDTVTGSDSRESIRGGDGNDVLNGAAGDDYLEGNAGHDRLFGGLGADLMFGMEGDDTLDGGAGADSMIGDAGFDFASYAAASSSVVAFMNGRAANTGDAAGDSHFGIEGIIGSAFADILGGDAAGNALRGGGGDDWLLGGNGADTLVGGDGNDVLWSGAGADSLEGGAGSDVAFHRHAPAGLTADLSDPSRNAGEAAGDVYSEVENLWGSDFADDLTGDGLANQVYGFAGDDRLSGGAGDDAIYAGRGADTVTGGAGADTFFLLQYFETEDVITDFASGVDRIFVSQYWFGLPIGPASPIPAAAFVGGSSPAVTAARPQFLYDPGTGVLSFDPDGTGGDPVYVLARLGAGAPLAAGDIWMA